MSMSRHYVLAAGGTGGHMIPAHALAEELVRRGHRVALITDDRGARIPGLFDKVQVHVLPAGRLSGGPLGWLRAARSDPHRPGDGAAALRDLPALGGDRLRRLSGASRPCSRRGATGIPTLIHEQNAVLGRVNRLMAGKVDAIATAYPEVERLPAKARRTRSISSAIRCATRCWRCATSPSRRSTEDGIFRLLVTGGSQGASILSEVVPDGLALLPEHFRRRLQVTQQCRAEDIEQVRARYAGARHSRRSRHLSAGPARAARPGRTSSSPAPAPRPSPS